ncbi:FCD domain-containing protein [Pseudomonas monteilii]|uniref:FCD domain-containing protein n=1 Tax=Pseudomonas monteilii TaxID=76759 RepID=UPI003CFD505E
MGLCIQESLVNGGLASEATLRGAFHLLQRMNSEVSFDGSTTPAWREEHDAFHEAAVAACANSWMLKVRSMLHLQNSRYRNFSIFLTSKSLNLESQHRALLEATLARDIEKTCSLMT